MLTPRIHAITLAATLMGAFAGCSVGVDDTDTGNFTDVVTADSRDVGHDTGRDAGRDVMDVAPPTDARDSSPSGDASDAIVDDVQSDVVMDDASDAAPVDAGSDVPATDTGNDVAPIDTGNDMAVVDTGNDTGPIDTGVVVDSGNDVPVVDVPPVDVAPVDTGVDVPMPTDVPMDTGPVVPTSVFVVRVGDGVAALTSAATPVFIEERRLSDGMLLRTINLPTATAGSNSALTLAGTSTSEGALTRSVDQRFVQLAGYAAAVGTTGVSSTTAASVPRVVARVDTGGVVNTTTQLGGAYSGGSVRGVTSVDGMQFWASGTSAGTVGGVQYATLGAMTTVQVLGTPNNARTVAVFNGQLYGTSGSSGYTDVFTVGTGTPTTAGQTATPLAGFPTMSASPYAFVGFGAGASGVNSLYVADDRALGSGGGIQHWTLMGSTWMLANTLGSMLAAPVRGVTGFTTGTMVVLAATTTEPSANTLVRCTDDGTANPPCTVIATAPANTVFRGVALAPH